MIVIIIISPFFRPSHLEALFLYPLLATIYEHLEKFDFLYFSLLSSPFFPVFLQIRPLQPPSLFFSHPSLQKEWHEQCLPARVIITMSHVSAK